MDAKAWHRMKGCEIIWCVGKVLGVRVLRCGYGQKGVGRVYSSLGVECMAA